MGNPRIAALMLLDKISNKTELFYSGDFDPEGLIIAQKLKNRYKDNLKLWHYELKDYKKAMSNKKISTKSLNKLKNIEDKTLITISNELLKTQKAAYQESIIEDIINELDFPGCKAT